MGIVLLRPACHFLPRLQLSFALLIPSIIRLAFVAGLALSASALAAGHSGAIGKACALAAGDAAAEVAAEREL